MPGKVVVPDKAVTPIPMYSTKPFRALIHLYQADGLPAADEGGSSDTYCLVRIARQQTQTQVGVRARPRQGTLSLGVLPGTAGVTNSRSGGAEGGDRSILENLLKRFEP